LVGLGHSESFKNDKIRYLGFFGYASVFLDFYKIGKLDISDHPLELNFKGFGFVQEVLFRLGDSNFFIGPRYGFLILETTVPYDNADHPIIGDILDKIDIKETFSKIDLMLEYDSRNSSISPVSGFYAGLELQYNAEFLGASKSFEKIELYAYSYVPINKWLYGIFHYDYQLTGGDIPFYFRPFVELRGAPAMRYQGDQVMLLEGQLRADVYKNWSLVGFGGVAKAFDNYADWNKADLIANYGVGFRYDFVKVFGLRAGADFAWTTQDDFGWYISIGTDL
jgi:hypothetical protein